VDWLSWIKTFAPSLVAGLALVSVGGGRLLALAAAIGLALAAVLLHDWPRLPHELWQRPSGRPWLFWCLIFATLVTSFERWRWLPPRGGLWVGLLLGGASAWFVLWQAARGEGFAWILPHVGAAVLITGGAVFASRSLIERASDSPLMAFVFVAAFAVDFAVLDLTDCYWQAATIGACAATVVAGIATAMWHEPLKLAPADGVWLGIAHALVLIAGAELGSLPWTVAALAAITPALPLVLPKSFAKERPKRWTFVALVLLALPAAGAIALVS